MKFLFPLMVFVTIASCQQAVASTEQKKITLSPISQNYFGVSVDFAYKWCYTSNAFYLGLGGLINPPKNGVAPNALFVNKAAATNFIEHIVLKGGYEYDLLHRNKNVRLFTFAELAIARTKLKNELYLDAPGNGSYNADTSFMVTGANYIEESINATFFNVNTGIGFEVPVTPRLGFQSRCGISPGFMIYKIVPNVWHTGIFMFYSFTLSYAL